MLITAREGGCAGIAKLLGAGRRVALQNISLKCAVSNGILVNILPKKSHPKVKMVRADFSGGRSVLWCKTTGSPRFVHYSVLLSRLCSLFSSRESALRVQCVAAGIVELRPIASRDERERERESESEKDNHRSIQNTQPE